MAIIKSNICDMCGGLLDIDIDRQVYICPFCGVTFDYEYFRKDNVITIAKTALKRREYGSARDAYEYMLKKDPHNFEALRGLILCKCRWVSMTPLLKSSEVFLSAQEPALINAINNCLPEHKEYFLLIQQAINILSDYRTSRSELANLENDRLIAIKRIHDIEIAQEINRTRFTTTWRAMVEYLNGGGELAALPLYISTFILIGLGYATFVGAQFWIPLVLAGLIILAAVIYNVRKSIIDKSLEVSKGPVLDKIKEIDSNINAKRNEASNYESSYKLMAMSIINTYPIEEEKPAPSRRRIGRKIVTRTSSDFPSTLRPK